MITKCIGNKSHGKPTEGAPSLLNFTYRKKAETEPAILFPWKKYTHQYLYRTEGRIVGHAMSERSRKS